MIAVLGEHAAIAAEFQTAIGKIPDLERLLVKSVTLLKRFHTCARFNETCTRVSHCILWFGNAMTHSIELYQCGSIVGCPALQFSAIADVLAQTCYHMTASLHPCHSTCDCISRPRDDQPAPQ